MNLRQVKKATLPVLEALGMKGAAIAVKSRYDQFKNRYVHNNNDIFYTLSPNILPAIAMSFEILEADSPALLETGAYYEFGVFKGFSTWFAEAVSRNKTASAFRFYGFDSFEGLPDTSVDRNPWWLPGNYAASYESVMSSIKSHGGDVERIILVKGFYSADLFEGFRRTHSIRPPAIVVIDSDIYESANLVLDFFGEYFLPGTILLFDDYNVFDKSDAHGERRALKDFESKNPSFAKRHLFDFGWHGAAYVVAHGITP